MLWLGITATVLANIAYGVRYGPLGAIVSAWPAIAFVGAAELLMGMIRRGRPLAAEAAPVTAEDRARVALAESIAAGNPFSERQLASQFGIGRAKAAELKTGLATAGNGQASPVDN
jgi:cytosine/adenosine deaminase-related metal-dependent hydrolase